MVFGKRTRGRPKTRYKDKIKELTNLSMVQVYRMGLDRREWRQFIMDATAIIPMIYPYNDDDVISSSRANLRQLKLKYKVQ